MSELETAQGGNKRDEDEECPLCLEALPPFWDAKRRVIFLCCGKCVCIGCKDNRSEFLQRAMAEGTFGRQEEELNSCCPLCRSQIPTGDNTWRTMLDRYEKGQLPLDMYFNLGGKLIDGGAGGVERNVERGMDILRLGAERGDPSCQYLLGSRYQDGTDGLPKLASEAKRWYLAAAEQGHAIAESALAFMLKEEGNDEEYVWYLKSSAAKGYDNACYNLGVIYYQGEQGIQKSTEKAIQLATPAAERGHVRSMELLGNIMCCPERDTLTVGASNPNYTKGVHWLRRAAEVGDQKAISKLKEIEGVVSRICFNRCNKGAPPETSFLRCSRCRAAWYCSKDCHVLHWKAVEGGRGTSSVASNGHRSRLCW